MPPLSILSFNIGQRGLALTLGDRTLGEFLVSLGAPDIVCFQETKTLRTDLTERTAIAQGYSCFFACHRSVSNWGGVLTCVRDGVPVLEVQAGLFGALSHGIVDLRGSRAASEGGGALALDSEGRVMLTDHGVLVLANVYLPALGGTTDRDARVAVKAAFCEGLAAAVVELQGKGRRVVICGDLNISHRPVDNSDAATYSRRHGGKPFEGDQFRVWLSGMLVPRERLLEGDARAARSALLPDALLLRGVRPLLVDSFRALHPTRTGAYTCWDAAASCRLTNHGVRVDFILVDYAFCAAAGGGCVSASTEACASGAAAASCDSAPSDADSADLTRLGLLSRADILADVQGSDHCPVVAHLDCELPPAPPGPLPVAPHPASSACFPEFARRQQSLEGYFGGASKPRLPRERVDIAKDVEPRAGRATSALVPRKRPRGSDAPPLHASAGSDACTASAIAPTADVPAADASAAAGPAAAAPAAAGPAAAGPAAAAPAAAAVTTTVAVTARGGLMGRGGRGGRLAQSLLSFSKAAQPSGVALVRQPRTGHVDVAAAVPVAATQVALPVPFPTPGVVDLCSSSDEDGSPGCADDSASGDSAATPAVAAAPRAAEHHNSAGAPRPGPPAPGAAHQWAALLKPVPPPLCRCAAGPVPGILRTVRKSGPNAGRSFYVCPKPQGAPGQAGAACDLFLWAEDWARKWQQQQQQQQQPAAPLGERRQRQRVREGAGDAEAAAGPKLLQDEALPPAGLGPDG